MRFKFRGRWYRPTRYFLDKMLLVEVILLLMILAVIALLAVRKHDIEDEAINKAMNAYYSSLVEPIEEDKGG